MPKAHEETSESTSPPGGLSDGLRTFISLLLFAHLFALAVAVLSNFGPVSPLRARLDTAFLGPYLRLLNMDVAYNFQLVDASELDAPLSLELDLASTDANDDQSLTFPPAVSPSIRSQRYYQLMLNVDLMQDDDSRAADLPKLIAANLLAEREVSSGKHRLRLQRHLLTGREVWENSDEAPDLFAANRFQTAYEADVNFLRGALVLIKQEAAAESAIVRPANP